MKKMIRTTLFSLSFVVAFLFVGIQSASAQFLPEQDATQVLLAEIPVVQAALQNTPQSSSNYVTHVRKLAYYKNMVEVLHDGMSVAEAIDYGHDLLPELQGLGVMNGPSGYPNAALRRNLRTAVVNLLSF